MIELWDSLQPSGGVAVSRASMVSQSQQSVGLAPLNQVGVRDAIQDRLVNYLRANHLSAGARLPSEHALASALGAGRNAVREALRGLEALGLVEARVGSGWYVRSSSLDAVAEALVLSLELNPDTLAGLNQIRVCLESGLFAQAAAALTPEDLDQLEGLAQRMEEQAAAGQYYFEADSEFHRLLYSRLGNPALTKLMDAIWNAYVKIIVLPASPLPLGKSLEEAAKHRPIVQALRAGDIALARAHLEESLAKIRRLGQIPTPR